MGASGVSRLSICSKIAITLVFSMTGFLVTVVGQIVKAPPPPPQVNLDLNCRNISRSQTTDWKHLRSFSIKKVLVDANNQ